MKKGVLIITYTVLLLVFCTYNCYAQFKKQIYPLQSFNVDDGLSEDYIYTLLEDRNGFIWIGTRNGLDRFNGYAIERITIDRNLQVQEQVRSLLEDKQGNIWIGTNNGLFCKDFETDIIRGINLNDEQVEVNFLFQDSFGSIWVGASNGILFSYKLIDGTSKSYSIPDKVFITSISQESEDLIIAFRYYGIARLNLTSERFFYSDEDLFFDNHIVGSINKLGSRNFVISTRAGTYLTEKNKQVQNINYFSTGIDEHFLKSVSTITQINDTSVWLGTDGLGVLNFNPVSKKNRTVNFESIVPIKSVTSILKGKNGLIWLATTNSGLHVFDPNRSLFTHWEYEKGNPTGLGGHSVLGITELINGDIAMALDGGGVSIYDRLQQRFVHSNASGIDVNNTVFQSKDDKSLWIGTFDNGLRFAKIKRDKNLEIVQRDNPIAKNSSIKCIYEDKNGNYWITTHTGLYKGVANSNKQIQIKKAENESFSNMFYVVCEGDDSTFWLGGLDRLLKYYPEKDSVVNIMLTSYQYFQVTSIAKSNENCIWVGTKMGLFKIDQTNMDTIQYTTKNGLPSNSVNSVLYDDNESLWLGTDHGLVQMNIAQETFRYFGKDDGIKGVNFNENAAFRANDGKLYFGTTNGVYSFYPEEIVKNKKAPDIVFTRFELFNKEIQANDESKILARTLDLTKTINLKHFQHGISVEFAAINYTNSSKNKYAYQLTGLSEDWIDLGNNRKVTWNNLPPGKYIIRIKASNNDGIWNNTGRKLEINIAPPWWKTWWKTWWALSVFSLIVIFLIVLVNRYVLKQFRLQDALKIEKIGKENQIKINDLKTQFFMNITHEFKTPLTLIISPLEKMITGAKNSNQKKNLVLMYRNAHRLLRLINQLMDFRKVEIGKKTIDIEQIELVRFIEDIILPYQVLAEENEISILFQNKPDKLMWCCDPDKLEKVIYNLLSNALKHTPQFGCVEIKLAQDRNLLTEVIDDVKISVIDNGPGIPMNEQEVIFDRFARLKNDTTTGTGIGLSLTKSFVEMHEGTIQVNSQLNKGSTFIVQLPLLEKPTKIESSALQRNSKGIKKEAIELYTNTPKFTIDDESENKELFKILIVEDEKDVREFITDTLNPYFDVTQAIDGQEGINLALKIVPDLIVSDILMPNTDGLELCRKLKTDILTSHIPIILLTALSSEEQQIKGLNKGADDYISKPFNANTLIYKIRAIIENRRKIINRFKTESAIKPEDIVTHSVDEELMTNTISIIKQHISDVDFTVDKLVEELGMSRSVFFRKIKAITLMSPNELIRTVRLKHSAELLLKSDLNISEISYEVGFVSPKYFRECFKKQFGVTPTEHIKRGTIQT